MAIDALLAALDRDVEAEVARLRTAAAAEAAALEADAAARIAADEASWAGALRAALEAEAALAVGEARRAARAEVLRARDALLARVLEATAARLRGALDGDEGAARLAVLVASARAYLGDAGGTMRCRPEFAAAVTRALAGEAAIRVEPDAAVGTGVVAHEASGRFTVEATLERLLAQRRDAILVRLAREVGGTFP